MKKAEPVILVTKEQYYEIVEGVIHSANRRTYDCCDRLIQLTTEFRALFL